VQWHSPCGSKTGEFLLMGMFSFFRGGKPVEAESKSVAFDDVGEWLEGKDKVLRNEEKVIFVGIGERLDAFYDSVEERLGVLGGIDIEGKKENERAKILVRQGLDKYVNSVRVLLKELGKISSPLAEGFDLKNRKGSDSKNPERFSFAGGLGEFAEEISVMFARFEKTSAKFYGRANYLIGDEMAAVRNEIRRFYNGLVETFEGVLIGDLKKVGDVRVKLDEYVLVEKAVEDVEGEIVVRDRKIVEAGDRVEELERDVEDMKGSSDYISGIEAREEVVRLRAGIDKEIGRLKELIDFKRLTNLVHSNEGELKIVKDYRAHFVEEFSKDNGARLFGLMEGTKMRSAEIVAKVELIERLGVELAEKRGCVGVDYTVGKLKEIERVGDERESVELENVKSGRRLDELRLKLKGLRNEALKLVSEF